jgi:hypothetical protein
MVLQNKQGGGASCAVWVTFLVILDEDSRIRVTRERILPTNVRLTDAFAQDTSLAFNDTAQHFHPIR